MVSINSNSDSLKNMGEDWKPSPELFDNMMNAVCLLSQGRAFALLDWFRDACIVRADE